MGKDYRIEFESRGMGEVFHRYDLISAENEHAARDQFWKEYDNTHGVFKILAVDELDPKSITVKSEGPNITTIPALQRLPPDSLVIRGFTLSWCEWGGERKVWRDAEGHRLMDIGNAAGCFGYVLDLAAKPYYLVKSSDHTLRVNLCQEHLEEEFPQWRKIVLPRSYSGVQ
jgi:hypothetical protein